MRIHRLHNGLHFFVLQGLHLVRLQSGVEQLEDSHRDVFWQGPVDEGSTVEV